ncbi:MAG: NAD(P)H-dependent glycerol-3-phosphate dehydrogenase [Candidatus Andersenbacteria bacterium]
MKPRLLIIGVGRMGDALIRVIAPTQQAEIAIFDNDTTKYTAAFPLTELAANADFIFLCIPASAVRAVITEIKNHLSPEAVVVSLVKGLDESGKSMNEILVELLPRSEQSAILAGPMLSGELLQGQTAYGLVATAPTTYEKLQALFKPTLVHVEYSADRQGTSIAGVLKNVYAIGLGIASALNLGANTQGKLVTQAIKEMTALIPQLGGEAATVLSLAGLGDLVATGSSSHSRNRTVGEELIQNGHATTQSEGLVSLPLLTKRVSDLTPYPLLKTINEVVTSGADARRTFANVL